MLASTQNKGVPVRITHGRNGRRLSFALLATVAAVTLAACTTSAPEDVDPSAPADVDPSAPADVDPSAGGKYSDYPSILTDASAGSAVTFWGWDALDFNEPVETYVEAVAGVTTTGRQIPPDKIVNQLQLAAQSGGLPDVFKVTDTTLVPTLVKAGALRDITDLVEPYREYLSDSAWEACTYDGKVYCMPANSPAGGVFYRNDVLSEYGIDPTTLTTWDAYIAAAIKLSTESNGEHHLFGFTPETPMGGLPGVLLNQAQAVLIDDDLKVQVSPDSEEWQNAMEIIRELTSTPDVGKSYPEWTPEWYQAIKDGSLSSYILGTWFVQTIIQQAPDSQGVWTYTPLPAYTEGGDRYPFFGSAFVALSPDTDKVDAAFELAKAWTIDPEGSIAIGLQELGISTVNTAALESEFVNTPSPYFANEQAYWKDATEAYTSITHVPPKSTAIGQALGIFNTNLPKFLSGQSTDDFLTQLAADLRQQIKDAK
jgi:multiple sugar transport system substrate-binding protein